MRVHIDLAHLTYEDIRKKADAFLRGYPSRIGPPVQIEEIVDLDMGIDIVPVPRLLDDLEIDGFTASDLSRVYVDMSVYQHPVEHRYRFTLAHEIAHMVLHRKVFERFQFSNTREYKDFVLSVDDEDLSWLEWQAYSFAGLVLVPSDHLEVTFREQLDDPRVQDQIQVAQASGLSRKEYVDYLSERIAERIARRFIVSTQVVQKRLKQDNLTEQIP